MSSFFWIEVLLSLVYDVYVFLRVKKEAKSKGKELPKEKGMGNWRATSEVNHVRDMLIEMIYCLSISLQIKR